MSLGQLPKYEQIKRSLIGEIESGRWGDGGAIPSEAQLLQRFRVSRPTLVRSLQDLVREGYVHRRQGKGTFVAPRAKDRESMQREKRSVPIFTGRFSAPTPSPSEIILRVLRGAQAVLGPHHLDLSLRYAANGAIDDETRLYLDKTQPAVALVLEPSFSPALHAKLQRRGWTVWALNEPWPDGNSVYIDQEKAGYLATKYLLEKGRRHIALLNGPLDVYWGFAAKHQGYRRALEEAGVQFDPRLGREGQQPIDTENGRSMMRSLLNDGVQVDGVVGASDSKALGAVAAAQDAGLRVPDDLAVIGIDDILAGSASPPIPAVALPFEEIGRRAAYEALRGNAVSSGQGSTQIEIKLKPTLVER